MFKCCTRAHKCAFEASCASFSDVLPTRANPENVKSSFFGCLKMISGCLSHFDTLLFYLSPGVITGVDENTAYSWPACNHCGSDNLEKAAGGL